MEAVKLSGSLSEVSCPRLIFHLFRTRFTGTLRVTQGGTQKLLYFQSGEIAMASSNDHGDHLAPLLIAQGKLKPEQLELARRSSQPGTTLARVLVQMGFLTSNELFAGARLQLRRIVAGLLTQTDGHYQLQPGFFPRQVIPLSVKTQEMLLDLVREVPDRGFILSEIGSPDTAFRPYSDAGEGTVRPDLAGIWKDYVHELPDRLTIHEFGERGGLDDFTASKAVYALHLMGYLERAPRGPETVTDAQTDLSEEQAPEPGEPEVVFAAAPAEGESFPSTLHGPETERDREAREPLDTFAPVGVEPTPPPFVQEDAAGPSPPSAGETTLKVSLDAQPTPPSSDLEKDEPSPGALDNPEEDPSTSEGESAAMGRLREQLQRLRQQSGPDSFEAGTFSGRAAEPRPLPSDERELVARDGPIRIEFDGTFTTADAVKSRRASGRWGILSISMGILILFGAFLWFIFLRETPTHPPSDGTAADPAGSGIGSSTGPRLARASSGAGSLESDSLPKTSRDTLDPSDSVPGEGSESFRAESPPEGSATADSPPSRKPGLVRPTPPAAKPSASGGAPPLGSGARFSEARARLDEGQFQTAAVMWLAMAREIKTERFTLQLAIVCQEDTLRQAAVNTQNTSSFFAVPFTLQGRDCFRLCWGSYPTVAEAQAARLRVPSFFLADGTKPVVVTLSSLSSLGSR